MTTKRFIAKNGIDNNGQTLTNVAAPTNTTDATNKAYVDSAVGIVFISGTRMIFAQATAPTGWTQDVSENANNRMLRVVNTAGNGVGGSHSPILNNVVPSHTHGFSTGTESADHGHSGNTGYVSSNHVHAQNVTANQGQGSAWRSDYNADGAFGIFSQGCNTEGISANHYHGFGTGGISANHTHSGSTDNGSSQTNWTPRYIDLIICSRN